MADQISPYRITQEELPELKQQVLEGLVPLLDALNLTLGELVAVVNSLPTDELRTVELVTTDTVSASFPLRFKTNVAQPRLVQLANIVPKNPNHSLSTPFVMQGFTLTDQGLVSIPNITGLLPLQTYTLTFLVR